MTRPRLIEQEALTAAAMATLEALKARMGSDDPLLPSVEHLHRQLADRLNGAAKDPEPTASPSEPMMSPAQVAERCGLSYHAVLRAIKRGDLAAVEPVPRRIKVTTEAYNAWLQERPVRTSAARRVSHDDPPERRRRPRPAAGLLAELREIERESGVER